MKTLSKCPTAILCCLTVVLLWSCNNLPSPSVDTITSSVPIEFSDLEEPGDQNMAIVHKFLKAQMTGDGRSMRNLVTSDFYAINPAGDSLPINHYVNIWEGLSESRSNQDAGVFATNSQSVKEGPLEGEWALFWGTYTASEIESDEALEILWHADFQIKNGKIKRLVSYFNMVDPKLSV